MPYGKLDIPHEGVQHIYVDAREGKEQLYGTTDPREEIKERQAEAKKAKKEAAEKAKAVE